MLPPLSETFADGPPRFCKEPLAEWTRDEWARDARRTASASAGTEIVSLLGDRVRLHAG